MKFLLQHVLDFLGYAAGGCIHLKCRGASEPMTGSQTATIAKARLTASGSRILKAKDKTTVNSLVTVYLHGAHRTWATIAATLTFFQCAWSLILGGSTAMAT